MLVLRGVRGKGSQGFWGRKVDHLAILEMARNLWRTALKRFHPDRPGGCSRKTVELNALWFRVRKRFAAKGYELY
jgi:hypothetical protein